jgi:hypothetical protein
VDVQEELFPVEVGRYRFTAFARKAVVEKYFALPAHRLYSYFAGSDDYQLRQEPPASFGPHYRGFHVPISGRHSLPIYLQECFFHPLEQFTEVVPFAEMVAFDNLIYVKESTCSDVTGCVTNYAHELQHFMQHGHTPSAE